MIKPVAQHLSQGHQSFRGYDPVQSRGAVTTMYQPSIRVEHQPLPLPCSGANALHHHVGQILAQRMAGKQNSGGLQIRQCLDYGVIRAGAVFEQLMKGAGQRLVTVQLQQAFPSGARIHHTVMQHPATLSTEHAR
ncbi:hypothetical protein A3Q32_00935 [Alcanivorax sp. KX64203]|nr:hypothetical protein A3Q32_00935 [Alcanivorax sp. KX64203]